MLARLTGFLALLALPLSLIAQAESDSGLSSFEMHGTVGAYRVGLNFTVRNKTALVAAHYFYASQLHDIPLQGVVQGETVSFKGSDGSAFKLHFVGNGSNGTAPLAFDNSIGLNGIWTLGSKTLPVKLQLEYSTANPGERWYADVTSRSDAQFEAMVQEALAGILTADPGRVAKHCNFPLEVNLPHGHIRLKSAVELKAQWGKVFPPQFVAKLRQDIPHEMFVHEGEAMLGSGELWFDENGLATVNNL